MQTIKRLLPPVLAGIAFGLLIAFLFLYLEFGGVAEDMDPFKVEFNR